MQVTNLAIKPKIEGEPGLPKESVEWIKVNKAGVEGDYNHYRTTKKKSTPDRAVLLFPEEMINQLNREGWPIAPGDLGENITTAGIPYEDFRVGKRYLIGEVELEISEPCNPCKNLSFLPYIGDQVHQFIETMKGRRGWYAKVIKEGMIQNKDQIIEINESVERK